MRIGIFGGTFNPIHLAHLRSAEEVREAQQLDRVLFIPSATPPTSGRTGWRPPRTASPWPSWRLQAITASASRPSRLSGAAARTRGDIAVLRARMPAAKFFFIMGHDAFREIATWKDYRNLFALCDLVVTSRPPYAETRGSGAAVAVRAEFCYRQPSKRLEHRTGNHIIFQRVNDLDISASAIRRLLSRGLSIRYLVPASVERYIARHGLYARRVRPH